MTKAPLTDAEKDNYQERLAQLEAEHRDLDLMVKHAANDYEFDRMALFRAKRRKLRLKDEISYIRNLLIPDIIA